MTETLPSVVLVVQFVAEGAGTKMVEMANGRFESAVMLPDPIIALKMLEISIKAHWEHY